MATIDEYLESLLEPKKPPQFPLALLYSEGLKHLRLALYEKAIRQFDKVLQIDAQCVKALLKRSECFLSLREYEKAHADAVESLQLNPTSIKAFDLKGKAEYLSGDFESAYVTYQKGLEIKPANKLLKKGHLLCKDTIYNSMPLRTTMEIGPEDIRNLKNDKHFIPRRRDVIPIQEDFFADKEFLEKFQKDHPSKEVHQLCNEIMDVINESQRFWQARVPLVCKTAQSEELRRGKRRKIQLENLTSSLVRCKMFLRRGLAKPCITESRQLIDTLNSCSDMPLNQKMQLKADVLHLLSLANKKEKNNFLYLQRLQEQLDLSQKHGLLVSEIRARHHLADYFRGCKNHSKAFFHFQLLKKKLASSELSAFLKNLETASDKFGERVLNDRLVIERATNWVRDFDSEFRIYINQSIIDPATKSAWKRHHLKSNKLIIRKESIGRILSDTESNDSQSFYMADLD